LEFWALEDEQDYELILPGQQLEGGPTGRAQTTSRSRRKEKGTLSNAHALVSVDMTNERRIEQQMDDDANEILEAAMGAAG
jgi:hypothetical protein